MRSFKPNVASDAQNEHSRNEVAEIDLLAQLYHTAALIYFNRAALRYTGAELHHKRLVDEALSLLEKVLAYEAPWPLFIIGCEARTDRQRRHVLQLFDAKIDGYWSGNMIQIRRMVEASWNQDDLHEEQSLEYLTKMSAVISSSPFLLQFA